MNIETHERTVDAAELDYRHVQLLGGRRQRIDDGATGEQVQRLAGETRCMDRIAIGIEPNAQRPRTTVFVNALERERICRRELGAVDRSRLPREHRHYVSSH